ncbi:helix-turn-helix domain-containing protein [Enterococcus sp. AZ196]|uniref:helix-turn-helix domain-containing protein n=1 Tax=Enterococcus sp. AZ196 TaxID=2774659 RepID=UPI003D2A2544
MIRNNLSILMSERGIKNSTLSAKTGISKNTISSTAQNDGKMIQLETINKICQVLGVTPTDFFSYIPYDIDFKLSLKSVTTRFSVNDVHEIDKIFLETVDLDLLLVVERAGTQINEFLFKTIKFSDGNIFTTNIFIDLATEDSSLHEFWKNIPTAFRSDITSNISKTVRGELRDAIIDEIQENQASHVDDLITLIENLEIEVTVSQLGLPF